MPIPLFPYSGPAPAPGRSARRFNHHNRDTAEVNVSAVKTDRSKDVWVKHWGLYTSVETPGSPHTDQGVVDDPVQLSEIYDGFAEASFGPL